MSHSGAHEPGASVEEFDRAPSPRHRAFALASLALLSLGVVAVAVGVARSLPEVLVPLLAVAVAGVGAWQALRHRARLRMVWTVSSALCAVAAGVLAGVVGVEYPLLLAGTALVAAGVAASGPALSWAQRPSRRLVGRCRRPVLFVNPRSGDGAAARSGLVSAAAERGIRVVPLEGAADLAELAATALAEGSDCLGMAGGDGSMATVAAAAAGAGVPFVCVPAGTRNHFAMDLGLDRDDPVAALDAFGPALQRQVDLGWVGDRPFVNNVSVGLYGEAVAEEDYRDQPLTSALQAAAELLGPDGEPLELGFEDGDGTPHEHVVVLHVSNNAHELGPGVAPTSRSRLDEGVLGVVAVLPGAGAGAPSVSSWRCDDFQVDGREAVAAGVDGEAVELVPPLSFRIAAGALAVRIPRDSAGVSPAARRPPLTTRTVLRLARVSAGRQPEAEPPAGGSGQGSTTSPGRKTQDPPVR